MKYMDMLVAIGIGNAHPGGFDATLRQLAMHPIPQGSHILEVGCGTGRTACYLAQQGYRVTAVDIRPDMIQKAIKRAEHAGADIEFLVADAGSLPFEPNLFDIVLVESVSIFADTASAVSEYNRVLKPGGKLYDREVVRLKEIPADAWKIISDFYGVTRLLDSNEWEELLASSRFDEIAIDGPHPFPKQMSEDLFHHPDPFQQIDPGQLLNPEIWKLQAEYDHIMQTYDEYVGYALMMGSKEEGGMA